MEAPRVQGQVPYEEHGRRVHLTCRVHLSKEVGGQSCLGVPAERRPTQQRAASTGRGALDQADTATAHPADVYSWGCASVHFKSPGADQEGCLAFSTAVDRTGLQRAHGDERKLSRLDRKATP